RALELGINLLDTSDAYGPFTNEDSAYGRGRRHPSPAPPPARQPARAATAWSGRGSRVASSIARSARGPRRRAALSGEMPSESRCNGTGSPLSIDRAGSSPQSEGLRLGAS